MDNSSPLIERGFFELTPKEKRKKLSGLEAYLMTHLIGQNEAVSAIARGYRVGLHGVEDPPKPLGSFLFLGPTGTGKSESIKRVAEWLWGYEENNRWYPGSRNRCIIFPMGDFGHADSIATFLGRPGKEEGQLYRIWREASSKGKGTTIVFDEADKCHKYIKNIFLNLLEEGFATTANGTEMQFRDFFIVATTNFGAGAVSQVSTDNEALLYDAMLKAAKDEETGFRPEGVARFGSVVSFRALSKETLNEIVKNESKRLSEKLCKEWIPSIHPELDCIEATLDEDAVDQIRKQLDNDAGGARYARTCVRDLLATTGLDYIQENHTELSKCPFKLKFTSVDSAFTVSHTHE